MAKPIFLTLEQLTALLGKDFPMLVYSDKVWAYPLDLAPQYRNQKDCPMLDVMIAIEKRAGSIIYVPNLLLAELAAAPAAEAKPAEAPKTEPAPKPAAPKRKPAIKKTGKVK